MKKLITIITSYVIFSLIILATIVSVFYKKPELLVGDEIKYIIFETFLLFFQFLPAIVTSGFLVGCTIIFSKGSSKIIMRHFRRFIINSIIYVSVFFIANELISPTLKNQLLRLKEAPQVFSDFYSLAENSYNDGQMSLAEEYVSKALVINPKDEKALFLKDLAVSKKRFEDKLLLQKMDYESLSNIPLVEEIDKGNFSYHEFADETFDSLLKKSDKAMAEKKWFDAHYYAYLATETGDKDDSRYENAKNRSIDAWSEISKPVEFEDSLEMQVFKQKRLAYMMLSNGDNIGAYYNFLEISNLSEKMGKDPDVVKFLKIAKERLERQYFFIDDIEDLKRLETKRDVRFSITHNDKTVDVVYIQGITPISDKGQLAQYFRGLSIYTFDENGDFLHSIYAPYAKMISEDVKKFDSIQKENYYIDDSISSVPFIFLQGLNSKKYEILSPVLKYVNENEQEKFEEKSLSKNYYKKSSIISYILGISIDNFNLICEASSDIESMSLISLWKVYGKAEDFGFSSEVYGANLLRRITSPLIYLILFIVLACIAWNYRLREGQIFNFKWIFLLPISTVVLYFILDVIKQMMKILNYVFVAYAGYYAIFIAVFVEVIAIVIFSIRFILKKE